VTAPINIDLRKISISPEIAKVLSASMARRLGVLPIARRCQEEEEQLIVAFRNYEGESENDRMESILDALEQIEDAFGERVVPCFAEQTDLFDRLHRRIYPKRLAEGGVMGSEALFHEIVTTALVQRASDIHVDAEEAGAVVRLRVDGRMLDLRQLDDQELSELIAVIKLNADLDIAERRTPLDGAIALQLEGDEVSMRVATIPTLNGEHITLRILADSASENLTRLDDLCMSERHLALLKRAVGVANGIVLVSGPTGSGKTTTLYAVLRHLRDLGGRHIISIENPVEMPLPGITQVKIDEGGDRVTFNKALRSVLRHDPDVVLIGEIRDEETADIAVRAALTGHLVLSTVHTNDAVGVVTRLLDLGLPGYLVAATLRLIMAQRLVRRPSPYALQWRRASEEECIFMGCDPSDAPELPCPGASALDGNTGYAGRAAIYEMVPFDSRFRSLLLQRASEEQMANYVFNECGHPNMRQDGIAKVLSGITTLDEVKAVTAVF
jgi:type II secretory ATPase GspE/PulE/Tfp pilus assembly ATPase PilB-like protein